MATITEEPVLTIPSETTINRATYDPPVELLKGLEDLRARIQDLEKSHVKITANQKKEEDAPSDEEDEKNKRYPCDDTDNVIMDLRYVKWDEFKTIYAEETRHVIDVLEGPAQYFWQKPQSFRSYDHTLLNIEEEGEKKQEGDPKPKMDTGGSEEDLPERIRINSSLLVAILKDIVSRLDTSAPFVILRPYKVLVGYNKEIRERHRQLAAKWGKESGHKEHDGPTPIGTDKEPIDSRCGFLALDCLVRFMDQHLSPLMNRQRALLNGSSVSPSTIDATISFSNLWYLYHPGMQVVCWFTPEQKRPHVQPTNRPSIWKVLQVSEGRHVLNSGSNRRINPLIVRLYKIGYDGNRFGAVSRDFHLSHFSGERPIRNLGIVPTRFVDDYQTIRKELLEQGKLFATFATPQHHFYSGPTLSCQMDGTACPIGFKKRSDYIKGNIIVDFKTARNEDEGWVPNLSISDLMYGTSSEIEDSLPSRVVASRETKDYLRTFADITYDDDWVDSELSKDFIREDAFLARHDGATEQQVTRKEDWTEDELVMMPDRACAWDLHRRRWGLCDLRRMQPVPTGNGWDDLKLRRGHKDMLYAQVTRHFADRKAKEDEEGQNVDIDLVRGKGEGLIILLHGEPGVGKTSTAESIAAFLRRPLYPITCGDLGTNADTVEDNLNRISAQAEAWNCVLLLDEADVFLARRSKTELERNAIVSVFLRILEYYKGLLFLTTNRVGSFDEAFVSRIHLAVYYPSLNKGQNRAIWETNLDRAKKRKPSLNFDKGVILDWADANWEQANQTGSRWNGRQIRNGCQTAIALAESEAEKYSKPVILEVKHIEEVAKASKEFYDYVSDTLGSDMAHRAMVERLRLDDWLPNLSTSRTLHGVTRARHQVNLATEDFATSTRNRNVQQVRRSGGRSRELLSSSGGGGRRSPHTPTAHFHQVQSFSHDDYDDIESPVRLPARKTPESMRREMPETHVLGYDDEYDDFE